MLRRLRRRVQSGQGGMRDRLRHGGARLSDAPERLGSSGYLRGSRTLWLVPLIVIVGAAAAFAVTTGMARSTSPICDTLRVLQIGAPKSCREVVWVRAKSRTMTRPILIRDTKGRARPPS
jgi:hypothetical protein